MCYAECVHRVAVAAIDVLCALSTSRSQRGCTVPRPSKRLSGSQLTIFFSDMFGPDISGLFFGGPSGGVPMSPVPSF